MKFPSKKIIQKQRKRLNIQLGVNTPCIVKFWRKQRKAWRQSYVEMTALEYWNGAYKNYVIRAQEPYTCVVYVCKRKKPLSKKGKWHAKST